MLHLQLISNGTNHPAPKSTGFKKTAATAPSERQHAIETEQSFFAGARCGYAQDTASLSDYQDTDRDSMHCQHTSPYLPPPFTKAAAATTAGALVPVSATGNSVAITGTQWAPENSARGQCGSQPRQRAQVGVWVSGCAGASASAHVF